MTELLFLVEYSAENKSKQNGQPAPDLPLARGSNFKQCYCFSRYTPLLAIFVLAGCLSPQTHYYSLTPVESTYPIHLSGAPLQVSHVSVPPALDRESIVEWTDSGELKISGSNRWAAPLDEMIQSVVAADLRRKLPGKVLSPGDPIPQGDTRGIMINVRHFAAQDSDEVVFMADWSMMSGHPAEPILIRSETIKVPIHSNRSSDVVPAMSQAVAVLSDRIANVLNAENERMTDVNARR